MFRLVLFIACLPLAIAAYAHAPYEVAVGSFQSNDGKRIFIVEHYRDGIIGRDYVIHHFRSEDGELNSSTEVSKAEVITRALPNAAEIYYYPSAWLPFATNVIRFDGYSFSKITTSQARFFSLLLHTWRAKGAYLFSLVVGAVILNLWLFLAKLPPDRPLLRLITALVFVPLSLCWIMFLLFAPVSPLIVVLCLALIFSVLIGLRKVWGYPGPLVSRPQKADANQKSQPGNQS